MTLFGKYLRHAMWYRLERQKTVAHNLGVSATHINRIMCERSRPSKHLIFSAMRRGYITEDQKDEVIKDLLGEENKD